MNNIDVLRELCIFLFFLSFFLTFYVLSLSNLFLVYVFSMPISCILLFYILSMYCLCVVMYYLCMFYIVYVLSVFSMSCLILYFFTASLGPTTKKLNSIYASTKLPPPLIDSWKRQVSLVGFKELNLRQIGFEMYILTDVLILVYLYLILFM